jgi:hypothetical protein
MRVQQWYTTGQTQLSRMAPPGDTLLLGLALLSCLLGGWLLGYGLSPWIRDSTTFAAPPWTSDGLSSPAPISPHEWPRWRQSTKR